MPGAAPYVNHFRIFLFIFPCGMVSPASACRRPSSTLAKKNGRSVASPQEALAGKAFAARRTLCLVVIG